MAKVFVSYSRKDIEFAKRLTAELQKSELDFWVDWEGIPPTVDWWKQIEKGIEEADAFLFLISPDSAKSKVCGQEIDCAVKNGKRIIPIVVREIEWQDTPPQLGHLNYIFFSRNDDFDTAVNKLMTAIHTDYEWMQTHRRLQVKALEWERNNHENSFLLRGKDLQDAEFQLATNTSKEPHPTDLQRDYVFKSRQAADRQRRITMGISVVGIIALAALAVFGFVQAKLATDKANIALARQLASQAQPVFATGNSKQMTVVLLALQSMRLFPTGESAQILQNNTLAHPISVMPHYAKIAVFSPNNRYVASGGCDQFDSFQLLCTQGFVHVWEAATGKEVARMAHDGVVNSIAFSSDGKYLVSGSDDNTARVWEAATGKEIARMPHYFKVNSVAFSPDGKYVVSGSSDVTTRVWEAATGKEVARMDRDARSVAFSPDGKYVVSGSIDNTARVWEAVTGKEITRMTHDSTVESVVFSANGKYVVSGSLDKTVRVWEAVTGKEIARMTHDGGVDSVAFNSDGKYVVSGSDKTARVWEVATSKEVARMTHDEAVSSVAFSPNGKYVVSGSWDATARVWETATGKEIARITYNAFVSSVAFSSDGKYVVSGGCDEFDINITCVRGSVHVWEATTGKGVAHTTHGGVSSVAFSPDGKYVVSGSDNTARVWETATGKEIAHMTHDGYVISVAFSPDGKHVISGGCDKLDSLSICTQGSARLWEAATGKEIARMTHLDPVNSVAFSPDGKYVVSGSLDRTARVWEASTGKEIAHITHDGSVDSVAFSPDGKYVVSGSLDRTARVWEASTGKEIAHITHDGSVDSVAFSPDGNYVISGGDNTARVWEAATGKEIARMNHDRPVSSVAFSPDGKFVVSGSYDKTARVWEATTGKEVTRMNYDDTVWSIAFNPDGKYVVSAGCDLFVDYDCSQASARVWEATTGTEIVRMTHDNYIFSVAFSPDGKYVVSGSIDTTARVWVWRPDDLIAEACSRVTRNLTHAEWAQYIGDALPYQAVCPNLPLDLSYFKAIAKDALSNVNDPDRVKTALDKVKAALIMDVTVKDASAESTKIVSLAVAEQILAESTPADIDKALDLFEQAKQMQISVDDANTLNGLCWFGSLNGYEKHVLKHCESAVKLAPGNAGIRDSRGLARALTGDYQGAIIDFQYLVDNPGDYSNLVELRKQWIEQLKKGINPFNSDVLESLKSQ